MDRKRYLPSGVSGAICSRASIVLVFLLVSACQNLKDAAVDRHYEKIKLVELRHEFNRTYAITNDRLVHQLYLIKSQDWKSGTDPADIKTEEAKNAFSFRIPSHTTSSDCFYIVMQKDGGLFLTPDGLKKQPGWCFKNPLTEKFNNSIQKRRDAKNAEAAFRASSPDAEKCEQNIAIPPAKFCQSDAAVNTAYHLCLVPIGKRLCKRALPRRPFQVKIKNSNIQPFVDTIQCSVILDFAASKDIVNGLKISIAKQMIGSLGNTAKWLVDRATEAQVLHCLLSTKYSCSTTRSKKVPCFSSAYIAELKRKDEANLAELKARVEQSGNNVVRAFDDLVVERF